MNIQLWQIVDSQLSNEITLGPLPIIVLVSTYVWTNPVSGMYINRREEKQAYDVCRFDRATQAFYQTFSWEPLDMPNLASPFPVPLLHQ